MILISIIVPFFNAEKQLSRCIDSILSQTISNFELLLIDDGSTDSSSTLCEKYQTFDSRIKLFHIEHEGVSCARNLGLKKAKGKWICFIDADDYISPNYLEPINFCSTDIIFTRNNRIKSDGSFYVSYYLPESLKSNEGSTLLDYLIHPIIKVVWAKIINREIIDDLNFNIDQTIGEDTLFMYSLLQNVSSFSVCNDSVYYWQESDIGGDNVKYFLTPKRAATYFVNVFLAYNKLNFKSFDAESFFINYYFSICYDKNRLNYVEWFSNEHVMDVSLSLLKNCPHSCKRSYWLLLLINQIKISFGRLF